MTAPSLARRWGDTPIFAALLNLFRDKGMALPLAQDTATQVLPPAADDRTEVLPAIPDVPRVADDSPTQEIARISGTLPAVPDEDPLPLPEEVPPPPMPKRRPGRAFAALVASPNPAQDAEAGFNSWFRKSDADPSTGVA